jgi:predicted GNAT family N-acyltransferase
MIEIIQIEPGDALYKSMVALRNDALRKPLGLLLTPDELQHDKTSACWGVLLNNKIIGCYLADNQGENGWKMRQVAVAATQQNKGIGRIMLGDIEDNAKLNNVKLLHCNARKTAVEFYQKSGWIVIGEEFDEVGIPHYKMKKEID